MAKVTILKEDVDFKYVRKNTLTNDCKFVLRATGEVDLVRAYKAVDIFDYYYDRFIMLKKIWHAGGTRNPKFQEPEF